MPRKRTPKVAEAKSLAEDLQAPPAPIEPSVFAACSDCTFFRASRVSGRQGECHRFPETASKAPADWCGEFKPKEG